MQLQKDEKTLRLMASGFTNKMFHVVILPTRSCQCSCTYCYESRRKDALPTKDLLSRIYQFLLLRREQTQHFNINWFGGEPMLCFDDICTFLNKVSDSGIEYDSIMTTNFLDVNLPRLNDMVALRLRSFQVTLDGTKEYHDKKRVTANGMGTWSKIMENLETAKTSDLDFKILVRLHSHGDNTKELLDLVPIIKKKLGGDRRFKFYVKKISGDAFEGGSSTWMLASNEVEYELRNHGLELVDEPAICYAGKANSLIFDTNGRIKKCTHYIDHEGIDSLNDLGHINYDGTLEIDQAKFNSFVSFLANGEIEKAWCPYKYLVPENKSAKRAC